MVARPYLSKHSGLLDIHLLDREQMPHRHQIPLAGIRPTPHQGPLQLLV